MEQVYRTFRKCWKIQMSLNVFPRNWICHFVKLWLLIAAGIIKPMKIIYCISAGIRLLKIIYTRMVFHTNHIQRVMTMNKTTSTWCTSKLWIKCKATKRKIFRPLYLCTFASDKSCLTESYCKSTNLRLFPSHYPALWEKTHK